jgi:hypothetical protein
MNKPGSSTVEARALRATGSTRQLKTRHSPQKSAKSKIVLRTAMFSRATRAAAAPQEMSGECAKPHVKNKCYELLNLSAFMIFKLSAFLCRMPIAGGRSP